MKGTLSRTLYTLTWTFLKPRLAIRTLPRCLRPFLCQGLAFLNPLLLLRTQPHSPHPPPPALEFDFSQLFASATNIASTSLPAPTPEYVSPQLLTLDTNIAPMCQVSGHKSHVSSEQRPFAKRNVSRGVHIKRPANCFMLYRSDRLKMIRHAHLKPSNAMGQCSQMIAQLWKDESASVRQQYVKRARDLANLHAKTFPNYKYSPRKK